MKIKLKKQATKSVVDKLSSDLLSDIQKICDKYIKFRSVYTINPKLSLEFSKNFLTKFSKIEKKFDKDLLK